eukprot:COSAG01_NODE_24128_length_789_cov_1.576812_1_plen_247_part_00
MWAPMPRCTCASSEWCVGHATAALARPARRRGADLPSFTHGLRPPLPAHAASLPSLTSFTCSLSHCTHSVAGSPTARARGFAHARSRYWVAVGCGWVHRHPLTGAMCVCAVAGDQAAAADVGAGVRGAGTPALPGLRRQPRRRPRGRGPGRCGGRGGHGAAARAARAQVRRPLRPFWRPFRLRFTYVRLFWSRKIETGAARAQLGLRPAPQQLGAVGRPRGEWAFPHFVRPFGLGFAYMLRVLVMK